MFVSIFYANLALLYWNKVAITTYLMYSLMFFISLAVIYIISSLGSHLYQLHSITNLFNMMTKRKRVRSAVDEHVAT